MFFSLCQRWLRFLPKGRIWTTSVLQRGETEGLPSQELEGGAYKDNPATVLFSMLLPPFLSSFQLSPQKHQQGTLPGAKAILLLRAHRHLPQINTYCDALELVQGSHMLIFVVPWPRIINKPVPEACHTPVVQNNFKCILICCLNWAGV